MKKITKTISIFLTMIVLLSFCTVSFADQFDDVMNRWRQKEYYSMSSVGTLEIAATYFSAEYLEAYFQKEAKKNLWTEQELEDFKLRYLSSLNMNEMIPIRVEFVNYGPTMYMSPFDIQCYLKIRGKDYKLADYDKRLNFKFQGEREGLIYFPRYDPKTGKSLLEGVKEIYFTIKPTISSVMDGKQAQFIWNVAKDDPGKLFRGKTGARMELDRLMKRLELLRKDRAVEEQKIKAIDTEISSIQKRVDQLSTSAQ
ncbi:MAG: hypothetical protein Q4C78_05365 [Synergistaceae bacterium]|nr:hypothetical protein [Synergistaceae bacterium]